MKPIVLGGILVLALSVFATAPAGGVADASQCGDLVTPQQKLAGCNLNRVRTDAAPALPAPTLRSR